MESYIVIFVSNVYNFWVESGVNELCVDFVGDGVEESCDCCMVLGIEVCVNFVKDDYWVVFGCL